MLTYQNLTLKKFIIYIIDIYLFIYFIIYNYFLKFINSYVKSLLTKTKIIKLKCLKKLTTITLIGLIENMEFLEEKRW